MASASAFILVDPEQMSLSEMIALVNDFVQVCQNGQMLNKIKYESGRRDIIEIANLYADIVVRNASDLYKSGTPFKIINSRLFLDAYRNSNKEILKLFPEAIKEICMFDIEKMFQLSKDTKNIIIMPEQNVKDYLNSTAKVFDEIDPNKTYSKFNMQYNANSSYNSKIK